MSTRPTRIALVLLLAALAPASASAKPAGAKVIETYEISGERVSQQAFTARLRALEGHADYHCKKTTFGGVVTFKAHDAAGRWFRVTQVSGSERPSTIEPTDPPARPGDGG